MSPALSGSAATLCQLVSGQPHSLDHRLSLIGVRDDGILEFRYRDGIYLQLEDAEDLIRAALDFTGDDVPLPTIVHLGNVRGSTREAREYMAYSDENQRLSSRVALVVTSRIGRMLVNLLFGLSPPRIPTRAFTDEAAALAWLENPHDGPCRRVIQEPEPELEP
jgi:hypothetical protein